MKIFKMHSAYIVVIIMLLGLLCSCAGDSAANSVDPDPEHSIVISLASFDNSLVNGQAFYNRVQLNPANKSLITVTNVTSQVSFVIVQVHTQEIPITLSYNKTTTINGSNVGLAMDSNAIRFTKISVTNDMDKAVSALIAVIAYTENAPKPGGCNMEFEVEVAPYQKLNSTNSMIQIDAQPASMPTINGKKLHCESNFLTYETYRLYIPEWDFSDETYFSNIIKMLTVDSIIKNGQKTSPTASTSIMRRVYSAYAGSGSVYAMVATFNNSAAYVPIFSYGCSPLSNEESCLLLDNILSKILCALIFFMGIFLTFIGHRCFNAEMFILGCFGGGLIGSIILYAIGMADSTLQIGITIAIGIGTGIIWIIFYHSMGMPCIAILQASMSLGILVASTTYFGISDDVSTFKNDMTFWLIYSSIILAVLLVLCISPLNSNIICCAFLGSYVIVLPIDYWLGSSLKYIIINTIRRITVAGFNVATINPPFQAKEIWLSVFWVLLALFGMHVQRRSLQGKPPFPSGHCTIIRSESSPILSDSRNGRRVLIVRQNDSCYRL